MLFAFIMCGMKKAAPLLLFPLLLLPSCSLEQGVLSSDYSPNPELNYVLRDGNAYLGGETPFVEDPNLSLRGQNLSGESLLYYFSRPTCHYCQEVEPAFSAFLKATDIKVISLTDSTAPSYAAVASYLEATYPDSGRDFFRDWGTPLLFSLKGGEFHKIEIYGNHKNEAAVSKLLTPLYSFPYIYELSSFRQIHSFLDKGHPVVIAENSEDFSLLYSFASSSQKKTGVLFKNKLSEGEQASLTSLYGDGGRLLYQSSNLDLVNDKEGCSSSLRRYFEV